MTDNGGAENQMPNCGNKEKSFVQKFTFQTVKDDDFQKEGEYLELWSGGLRFEISYF